MGLDIEAPEIAVMVKGRLMQRRKLSSKQKELASSCRRRCHRMSRPWSWTCWRNELAPFVFFWRVAEGVVVEEGTSIVAEEFASDTPEVGSVGAGRERGVGASAWRTFDEFFGYLVRVFPFLTHLLIHSMRIREVKGGVKE